MGIKGKVSSCLVLSVLSVLSVVFLYLTVPVFSSPDQGNKTVTLVLFHSDTCPHCQEEKVWLDSIRSRYANLVIEEYEIGTYGPLFQQYCDEYNTTCAGVPRTFINGKVFAGFVNGNGELVYNEAYKAYMGYSSQIEKSINECAGSTCSLAADDAIRISREDPLVRELVGKSPDSISTVVLVNHTYYVAWWTADRLSSTLYYPNVLVYVNGDTGKVVNSIVPTEPVPGLEKPEQLLTWADVALLAIIGLYLLAYLVLNKRLGWSERYWLTGFISLVIVSVFVVIISTPAQIIEKFAEGFPFPVFVFIVALADGFNPCAFTVLIVLLSLLTYTKSRRKMLLIGGIFIVTSGLMYFLFIMAMATFLGSWVSPYYRDVVFELIGIVVLIAGLINVKDYFFFKKGVSLGISEKHRGRIFKNAGKIVRDVENAKSKRSLFMALVATAFLATFVNLVEFGCTAMLPMTYTSALFAKYGSSQSIYHYLFTAFYCVVYVLPLFAILANFLYSFKSERLTEKQARILKLLGGIIMILMGIALVVRPSLPAFA